MAIGRGYVETGMRYPAHCQVMFRADLVHCDDPAYQVVETGRYLGR